VEYTPQGASQAGLLSLASSKVDSLAATVGPPGQKDWAAASEVRRRFLLSRNEWLREEGLDEREDPLVSTKDFSYAGLNVRLCECYGSKRPRLASEVELRVAAFCGPFPRRGEADASN
jgi:hypothetical protein